jgi:hypothetical protein
MLYPGVTSTESCDRRMLRMVTESILSCQQGGATVQAVLLNPIDGTVRVGEISDDDASLHY